ncbi:MAG: NTP transferase domain-containing protein, partial [Acidimicrobiia bacterium]|nr:NTP transferase domain-containing protein [Acidimicrobiia bacterium]
AGGSLVIWANHMLRAAVSAMQATAATIFAEESLLPVEERIASVSEIFRLQGAHELAEAEQLYLPSTNAATRAVVLAAGAGSNLGELTADRPKTLIEINGKPIVQHIVDAYNSIGVKDVTVVRGYRKDTFDLANVRYADNDDYEITGELVSLARGLEALPAESSEGNLLISYGDVMFNKFVPQTVLDAPSDLVVNVDIDWSASGEPSSGSADLVECTAPYSRRSFSSLVGLKRVSAKGDLDNVHGEWMGFLKVAPAAQSMVRRLITELVDTDPLAGVPELLNVLIERGQFVEVIYTSGHWLDVDNITDVLRASSFGDGGRR